MAIAFANVSIHTRAKGHSSVAASTYRSGTKLVDERTGITHDYSNRQDVVFSKLLLPEGSDAAFLNREFLWNQVELAEKRRDAQVCKDVMLALPKELNLNQQIELATQFAQTHFVNNGIPTDLAIHDHGDGNPHAHLLITTRRLERNRLSTHKARDLNPTFAKKRIVDKEYWGELWRDFQNEFFKEQDIDLSVDLNHVLSEKHRGRIREQRNSYVYEEKELIKEARREFALNFKQFLKEISKTHSVFTRPDIEKLIFKTFEMEGGDYLQLVAQILENKQVIHLGPNSQGIDAYTTRRQYRQEGALLNRVEKLYSSKNHVPSKSFDTLIAPYDLNEEQAIALNFIATGEDISLLVGRPGAGKSYLLKPLREVYEANQYTVLGAALSGKVAKALHSETGITSSTIASLSYRLQTGRLMLNKNHILIIDEAGMVDFDTMAYLIKTVKRAGAKLVLVGDPEQLKPIHKGEIFRGIAARIGYIELGNIKRQHDLNDRKASLALAKGDVASAIQHYFQKGALIQSATREKSVASLIDDWGASASAETLKEQIILAYSRVAVANLNNEARKALQTAGLVGKEDLKYFSENGEKPVLLSKGDRILLRQNNRTIGIRNGDLATIKTINAYSFTALLDSGEVVTIPRTYKHIEYGYALTVHKSQGMTKDTSFVFIDSKQWDKHLAFVAMTRHKEQLKIYSHKSLHSDTKKLITTLSRSVIKDNVIDWPLDFATRYGFDTEGLIGSAIQHISNTANTIKDTWNYLVNYEAFLKTKDLKDTYVEQKLRHTSAQQVATLMDEAEDLSVAFKNLEQEANHKNIKLFELPGFEALYQRSLDRDAQAANLWATEQKTLEKMAGTHPHLLTSIKNFSNRFDRYKTIEAIARIPITKEPKLSSDFFSKLSTIDINKDYPHIVQLGAKSNKTVEFLINQIKNHQKLHQTQVLKELGETFPVLKEYLNVSQQRLKVSGFKGEQLDNSLSDLAKKIYGNQDLMAKLDKNLSCFFHPLKARLFLDKQEKVLYDA